MSLYHEAASVLSGPRSDGGNLKSQIFRRKDLKSPPAQLYALALESCKWSAILKEVIENSQILQHERKVFNLDDVFTRCSVLEEPQADEVLSS